MKRNMLLFLAFSLGSDFALARTHFDSIADGFKKQHANVAFTLVHPEKGRRLLRAKENDFDLQTSEKVELETEVHGVPFALTLERQRELFPAGAKVSGLPKELGYKNNEASMYDFLHPECYWRGSGRPTVAEYSSQRSHLSGLISVNLCSSKGAKRRLESRANGAHVFDEPSFGGLDGLFLLEETDESSGESRRLVMNLEPGESDHRHRMLLETKTQTLDYVNDVRRYFGSKPSVLKHTNPKMLSRVSKAFRGLRAGVSGLKAERRELADSDIKYVEIYLAHDKHRCNSYETNGVFDVSTMFADGASIIDRVDVLYTASTGATTFSKEIKPVLLAQRAFSVADGWPESELKYLKGESVRSDCAAVPVHYGYGNDGKCEIHESAHLDTWNLWANTQMMQGDIEQHDNHVLLSGRDYEVNTVGLAAVGSMCDGQASGSVNMCKKGDVTNQCAATVAHEMGHNLGMSHDATEKGKVMASVGTSDVPESFGSESATFLNTWLSNKYGTTQPMAVPKCLENRPTKKYGNPECGNGLVEDGEDCDCGTVAQCASGTRGDCCHNKDQGALACKFKSKDASTNYTCDFNLGAPCCDSTGDNKCMFSSTSTVCRTAVHSVCDFAEKCPGNSVECVADNVHFPGKSCTLTEGDTTYNGHCLGGKCKSLEHYCAVDMQARTDDQKDPAYRANLKLGMTEPCQQMNDDCNVLTCHKTSSTKAAHRKDFDCQVGWFLAHGTGLEKTPDGVACRHPSDSQGVRNGICQSGVCRLPGEASTAIVCGNGGIDYGEDCDCGDVTKTDDPNCNCGTCKLKDGKECSSQGLDERTPSCCDESTGKFKTKDVECRAAVGDCDFPEYCSGFSNACPLDVKGQSGATTCTRTDSEKSTSHCYKKTCIQSLNERCVANEPFYKEINEDAYPLFKENSQSSCQSHTCKRVTETATQILTSAFTLTASSSIIFNFGVDNYREMIVQQYEMGLAEGTFLQNPANRSDTITWAADGKVSVVAADQPNSGLNPANGDYFCEGTGTQFGAQARKTQVASDCAGNSYFDISAKKCLPCSPSCNKCTGPGLGSCTGCASADTAGTTYTKDNRGMCPPLAAGSGVPTTIGTSSTWTEKTPEQLAPQNPATIGVLSTSSDSTGNSELGASSSSSTDGTSASGSGDTASESSSGADTAKASSGHSTNDKSSDSVSASKPTILEQTSTLKLDCGDSCTRLANDENFTGPFREQVATSMLSGSATLTKEDVTVTAVSVTTPARSRARKLADSTVKVSYTVKAESAAELAAAQSGMDAFKTDTGNNWSAFASGLNTKLKAKSNKYTAKSVAGFSSPSKKIEAKKTAGEGSTSGSTVVSFSALVALLFFRLVQM